MRRILLPLFLGLALFACSDSDEGPVKSEAAKAAEADPVGHMRAFIAEFEAKPEHTDNVVEVQHLLVSFDGKAGGATRTKDQAEQLAAELYADIIGTGDFNALVKEHTDDAYPGEYTMSLDGSAGRPRTGMVQAFGDCGWRLQVGEVGIAAYDATKSPYGWHIVKRIR